MDAPRVVGALSCGPAFPGSLLSYLDAGTPLAGYWRTIARPPSELLESITKLRIPTRSALGLPHLANSAY